MANKLLTDDNLRKRGCCVVSVCSHCVGLLEILKQLTIYYYTCKVPAVMDLKKFFNKEKEIVYNIFSEKNTINFNKNIYIISF